jgi:hypothetical protein
MRSRTVLNGVCGLLVAMSAVCSALAQTEQCNSGCNAVLQGGVFNEDKINSSQTSKDSFHDWMCVSEFKNHNEAHDAGINIGVVVYDVPISLGGTWKDGQREEWQRKSCTDQQRHAEKISTFTRALRTASPEILAAWSKCVETTCSAGRPRLKCEVTSVKGAALFKSNWIRQTGESAENAPKVLFYKAYDAKCDRAWMTGQRLKEGVTTFRCSPTADREAVFILETDGGSCTPTGAVLKDKELLSGRINLDSERHIKAEVITIAANTIIVTNGYKLTLEATEIEFQGAPKIISFEARPDRGAGENGRNAGPIILKATRVTGTSLIINNGGEDGVKGATGANGGKGPDGHQGTQRDCDITGAHGGSNGTNGGTGAQGGDGGTGGRGGNGGTVIYSILEGVVSGPIKRIDVVTTRGGSSGIPVNCGGTCGGVGAPGGDPGSGGPGGAGGAGAPGRATCGGTDAGSPGGQGPSGRSGIAGGDGGIGQIVVL